jgi:hypothetical protein
VKLLRARRVKLRPQKQPPPCPKMELLPQYTKPHAFAASMCATSPHAASVFTLTVKRPPVPGSRVVSKSLWDDTFRGL